MAIRVLAAVGGERYLRRRMKSLPCPICKKPSAPRAENASFPFCSTRCRQVDLGKWLGEEYRVPDRAEEDAEDERPTMEPLEGDEPPHTH